MKASLLLFAMSIGCSACRLTAATGALELESISRRCREVEEQLDRAVYYSGTGDGFVEQAWLNAARDCLTAVVG